MIDCRDCGKILTKSFDSYNYTDQDVLCDDCNFKEKKSFLRLRVGEKDFFSSLNGGIHYEKNRRYK